MWRLVRSAYWFVRDLIRSRAHLAAENQFLRQQLAVLRRQVGRARPTDSERGLLAFFARLFPWRDGEALHLVTPETLIRWHRLGWRLYWTSEESAEETPPGWATRDPRAGPRADPRHGPPQLAGPALGYQADPGGAREAQNLPIQEVGAEDPPGSRAAHAGRAARQRWSTFLRNHLACTSGLSTSSRCQRSSSASSTSSSS